MRIKKREDREKKRDRERGEEKKNDTTRKQVRGLTNEIEIGKV